MIYGGVEKYEIPQGFLFDDISWFDSDARLCCGNYFALYFQFTFQKILIWWKYSSWKKLTNVEHEHEEGPYQLCLLQWSVTRRKQNFEWIKSRNIYLWKWGYDFKVCLLPLLILILLSSCSSCSHNHLLVVATNLSICCWNLLIFRTVQTVNLCQKNVVKVVVVVRLCFYIGKSIFIGMTPRGRCLSNQQKRRNVQENTTAALSKV